ncbi:MAG: choice-of-anchor Q domain-containing protein [Anaerolineales bacterium]
MFHINNSVLAKNTSSMSLAQCTSITSSNHNLIDQTSGCSITAGIGDQFNIDPRLSSTPTGAIPSFAPLPGSPAINSADPSVCPATDQNGTPRPHGSNCDIGAHEYVTTGGIHLSAGSNQNASILTAFYHPLRAYVEGSDGSPLVGATVNFSAPLSGASGTFVDSESTTTSAVTNSAGIATVNFQADGELGNYAVIAETPLYSVPVNFDLTNVSAMYVTPTGDDSNNSCETPTDPCATLNGVINKAVAGATVYASIGTFTESTLTYVALINKDLTLSGGWDTAFSQRSGYSIVDGGKAKAGIGIPPSTGVVIDHFVVQNSARGITNQGTLSLNHSTIRNNSTSADGGGIYSIGNLTINNVTISSNVAGSMGFGYTGGGIYQGGGSLTVQNSTLVNNVSKGGSAGGGIQDATSGIITIRNSIIANNTGRDIFGANTPSDCTGTINVSENNIINSTSGCTLSSSINDKVNTDPQMTPYMVEYLYPLVAGSPAIDAGNPTTCLVDDQRGVSRPQGGVCDIGAYERPTTIGAAHSIGIANGSNQRAPLSTNFAKPLSVYVIDEDGDPVDSITVDFNAPVSGPSGTFAGTTATSASASTVNGIANSSIFKSNDQFGSYEVTASVSGVSGMTTFNLTNAGWFVSPSGSNSNSCSTPAAPCLTIAEALSKAAQDEKIYVEAGLTSPPISIWKSVSISGGWNSTFTSQNGLSAINGNGSRAISVNSSITAFTFSMDHFEVYNAGMSGGSGAGINISGNHTVQLSYVIIRNNSALASPGVALYNNGSNVTLDHVSIYDNVSMESSGTNLHGAVYSSGTLTVSNSYIGNNRGGIGSGIYNTGNLAINNSTIANNMATQNGGGIYSSAASSKTININNSTIAYNTASQGGGLYITSGLTAPVTINNSILSLNVAASSGPNCSGTVNSAHNNLFNDVAGCNMPAGSYITGDPQLSPIGIGNPAYLTLREGSPAIEAGDPGSCLSHDQRGATRPQGAVCDIGAYEFIVPESAAAVNMLKGTGQIGLPNRPYELPLSVYVVDTNGSPVEGVSMTFTAPSTGASGTFANSSNELISVTDEYGVATSSIFTANDILGSFTVTATTPAATQASFALRNTVWYVATGGADNASCGTSPASSCKTIDYAIANRASSGETLYVQSGIYTSTAASVVTVTKSVKLSGGWYASFSTQDDLSVIDGERARKGIVINSQTKVTVDHFIIQNGVAALYDSGGGIRNMGTLELNNSVVRFNDDIAIESFGPKLSINNSSISHNTNTYHGSQAEGAGMNIGGTVDINNTTINDNVINPIIGGYASYGGGIHMRGGNLTINNSTIVNNSADNGGGIYKTGTLIINNSILAHNTATNWGPDCTGITVSNHNIIGDTSGCNRASSTGDQDNIEPLLSPFPIGPTGYFPISSNSLAKDNGDTATCLSKDQRGVDRPQNALCDIGAYEYTIPGTATTIGIISGSDQAASPGKTFAVPFSLFVLDDMGSPVSNLETTFAAPLVGPSGAFITDNGVSALVTTDEFGIALSPGFRANNQTGAYDVTGSILGSPATVSFSLQNAYWHVSPTGNDNSGSNNCQNPASPCATINHAIQQATAEAIVLLSAGTYNGTGGNSIVTVSKNITLYGGWDSTFTSQNGKTVIDGQKARPGLKINTGVVADISNLTIQNGYASQGAGIYNEGNLTIRNSAIVNNQTYNDGAGIYQRRGQFNLANVTISNNVAKSSGGAIYVYDGAVVVESSTITQNTAVDSTATAIGGGLSNYFNKPVTIHNTIIAGNGADTVPDCRGQITSLGYNLIGNGDGCVITPTNGDQVGSMSSPIGAGLGNLLDNGGGTFTHALLTGSPAIDTGDPAACEAADQRGTSRPQGAACDIGAFEGSAVQTLSPVVRTYSAQNSGNIPGLLRCDESQPDCTGGVDRYADKAHQYALSTSNLYLTKHGRNGIDQNNMPIISSVHYCSASYCPSATAAWNGAQMVYGDAYGFALADDIVAHELTHAVIQYESNLMSFYQSGAINESLADLWGEYYDQTNGLGNDGQEVKWLLGEDIENHGAVRSMSNPPAYSQPDKMTSTWYVKSYDDDYGVWANRGVNNKAVFLMVDGGTFNTKTVTGIGWDKTAAIYYEAQTRLITSGSDYSDLYYAVQQACLNLTGQYGITPADCLQVKNALDAVQMNGQPVTGFNPDAPLCPTGMTTGPSLNLFSDGFEKGTGNWNINGAWLLDGTYASGGSHMMMGDEQPVSLDSQLTMANRVTLPAGSQTFLFFKHAFAFESYGIEYYDGAVLEYSKDDGNTWLDAKPLFSAGQNYKSTVFKYPAGYTEYGSALQGRSGFVGDSHGYVSSRYDLKSLAGQTVKFRWRFATDWDFWYWGWTVDDVRIYRCNSTPAIPTLVSPLSNALTTNYTPTLNWSDTTPLPHHYQVQIATDGDFTSLVYDRNDLPTSDFTVQDDLEPNTKYYWRAQAFNAVNGALGWSAARTFRTAYARPLLVDPVNGASQDNKRPTFDWGDSLGATGYKIQIAKAGNFSLGVINGTSTASTFTPIADLLPNTTYSWRVQATGLNGPSDWSETWSFTTGNPPNIPVLSAPASNALMLIYQPTLNWNDATPAVDHYQIQIATDPGFMNIELDESRPISEFAPIDPLDPNQKYYWRVRSWNTTAHSAWSAVRYFRSAMLPPVLVEPENAGLPHNKRPILNWDDTAGATGYKIQIAKTGNFSLGVISGTATTSTFTPIADLLPNTTYYWRVQATGLNGPSNWSETWSFTTGNPPGIPVLSAPASNALLLVYQPTLNWNDVTPVPHHYQIQIATNAGFTGAVLEQESTVSERLLDVPLNPDQKYYWRVRSYNGDGDFSAWSAARYFRAALLPPVLIGPVGGNIDNKRPALDWNDTASATSYKIQIAKAGDFISGLINGTSTASTFTPIADLLPNTTYYWRVQAIGLNGPSNWSDTWSFTTGNPPGIPVLSAPASNALLLDYRPTLNWNDATPSVDHYQIQIATDAGFTNIELDENAPISEFSPADPFDSNQKYYWRVRSWNTTAHSAWSAVRYFRSAMLPPALLFPANERAYWRVKPIFDWVDVTGATGYTIQVSTSPTFSSFLLNINTVTSMYTSPRVMPTETILYWRVRANGPNGPGAWTVFSFAIE